MDDLKKTNGFHKKKQNNKALTPGIVRQCLTETVMFENWRRYRDWPSKMPGVCKGSGAGESMICEVNRRRSLWLECGVWRIVEGWGPEMR